MAQRRFHYDAAFEHYLRANQIPYIAVDEARKALAATGTSPAGADCAPLKLKSFDFVVYSRSGPNLLVDVKGRKHSGRSHRQLDNWATRADVQDLMRWQEVFGSGFRAALVFVYWCAAQPPDALFQELFSFRDRWYALLAVDVGEYQRRMSTRSGKWDTVHLPARVFAELACPLGRMLQ